MRRLVSPLDGIRSPFGPKVGDSTPGGGNDVLLLSNGKRRPAARGRHVLSETRIILVRLNNG
jgi:hypothetical protein